MSYFDNSAEFLFGYGYSILQIDFSGFGKSPEPDKNYTIYDYANEVIEVLDYYKIDTFSVVGHSFGGRVALILNTKRAVQNIVLVDSAGLKYKNNLLTKLKIINYKIVKNLVRIKFLNESSLKKYGSEDYKNLSNNMKQVFCNVVNENLKDFACKVFCPTLIVWGDKDKTTPLYMAKNFKKYIKNSKIAVLKGGHFAYLENLFEFNNLLLEFLKESYENIFRHK